MDAQPFEKRETKRMGRRDSDAPLRIVDDTNTLSEDDLHTLKQIVLYWKFGKWTVTIFLTCGSAAVGTWIWLSDKLHLLNGVGK